MLNAQAELTLLAGDLADARNALRAAVVKATRSLPRDQFTEAERGIINFVAEDGLDVWRSWECRVGVERLELTLCQHDDRGPTTRTSVRIPWDAFPTFTDLDLLGMGL